MVHCKRRNHQHVRHHRRQSISPYSFGYGERGWNPLIAAGLISSGVGQPCIVRLGCKFSVHHDSLQTILFNAFMSSLIQIKPSIRRVEIQNPVLISTTGHLSVKWLRGETIANACERMFSCHQRHLNGAITGVQANCIQLFPFDSVSPLDPR